jgi:hypothetical protein
MRDIFPKLIAFLGLGWFLLVPLNAYAFQEEQEEFEELDETEMVAIFDTFFADPGDYSPLCEELTLEYSTEMIGGIPEAKRVEFQEWRRQFRDAMPAIEQARRDAATFGNELQFATADVVRRLEAGYAVLARASDERVGLKNVWEVAKANHDLEQAEDAALEAALAYMISLYNLQLAEDAQRKIATDYYSTYAPAFPLLEEGERRRILDSFWARTGCIEPLKVDLFEKLATEKTDLWNVAMARAGEVLEDFAETEVGAAAATVTGTTLIRDLVLMNSEESEEGTSSDKSFFDSFAEAALRDVQRQRKYAWLASESAANASVLSALLAAEDSARRGQVLHPATVRAALLKPDSTADNPPPMSADEREARLRMLQDRAWRGVLAISRKHLANEAAYRVKSSAMLGMGKAFETSWRQLRVGSEGLVANTALQSAEPHVQALAVLAISQKLFADSLGLLVTTPLQDAFTEYALKPAWGLFGEEVKTSTDKAFDDYKKARDALDLQEGVLLELWDSTSFDDAMAFAKAVRDGNPSGGGIGARARSTVRLLLEDAEFIAATDGGLPWIFEVICHDPADRNALLVAGARYELDANTRFAVQRIALSRGLTVDNPDVTTTNAVLDQIFSQEPRVPEDWQDAAVIATKQAMTTAPLLGAVIESYNAVQTLRNFSSWMYGTTQSQDDYLRLRVDLQQRMLNITNALEVCDYSYPCVSATRPDVYADHIDLVNRSSEYVNAFRRIQDGAFEREKIVIWARHLDPSTGLVTQAGRGSLGGAQLSQDMENADLSHRSGSLKVIYHVLSVNYAAAAVQFKALEALETRRRKVFNDRADEPVSYAAEIHENEAQAVRDELIAIYEGLYQSAIKDMVMSAATDLLVNGVMSSVLDVTDLGFDLEGATADAIEANVKNQLASKLNPWVGKFSPTGVYNTFTGAFGDSIKNSYAQVVARHQTMLTEAEVEQIVDITLSILDDVQQGVIQRVDEGDVTWALDRLSDQQREEAVEEIAGQLEAFYRDNVWPRRNALLALEDGPEADGDRLRLLSEIQALESNPRIQQLHRSLATAQEDASEVIERRFEAEQEATQAGRRIAAELATARARNRMRDAEPGSDEARIAALEGEAAEFVGRLAGDDVRVADVERLVAEDDSLNLSSHLLTQGLDVGTIRHALKVAKQNDPEAAARIDAVAKTIDRTRISVINDLLERFVNSGNNRDLIQIVIQGGAAEGNPEYQGIYGDIDFTVFTKEGADTANVKAALLAFFKENGVPLAEDHATEGKTDGFMDTEAFVQPWNRFDSGEASFTEVLIDVNNQRRDPTRFYSEGGGKWFLNNVAYSGKPLWSEGGYTREWIRVEPGEAYGLSVDMARYLGFLTDPDYTRDAVKALGDDTSAQQKQLYGALKNSKYFIRLVDAYLISHSGLGNALYNEMRFGRRPPDPAEGSDDIDDDASYHLQIFHDAETLVRVLANPNDPEFADRLPESWRELGPEARDARAAELRASTMITADDLKFIGWMANMKLKGKNPNPWDVVPGGSDAEKVENATQLTEWMQSKAPEMIAGTARTWRDSYEATMNGNDPEARQVAVADSHRIGSIILNHTEKDFFGGKSMMRPPVSTLGSEDDPMYSSLSVEDHQTQIALDMAESRRIRRAMKQPTKEAINAVKADYPPTRVLSGPERKVMEERLKSARTGAEVDATLTQEAQTFRWIKYWLWH